MCPGLALAKPVLDAFADDEEVALDEPLDDLAVPLLPRAQPAGRGHRLVTTGDKKSNVDNFPTNKYFVSVFFFFFFSSAGCTTHCVQEVNGLAFAGAAEACS